MTPKGCEYHADYKIGEIYANGKNNVLSSLGCNIFEWQDLEFSVHQKQAEIQLNGKPINLSSTIFLSSDRL